MEKKRSAGNPEIWIKPMSKRDEIQAKGEGGGQGAEKGLAPCRGNGRPWFSHEKMREG